MIYLDKYVATVASQLQCLPVSSSKTAELSSLASRWELIDKKAIKVMAWSGFHIDIDIDRQIADS